MVVSVINNQIKRWILSGEMSVRKLSLNLQLSQINSLVKVIKKKRLALMTMEPVCCFLAMCLNYDKQFASKLGIVR